MKKFLALLLFPFIAAAQVTVPRHSGALASNPSIPVATINGSTTYQVIDGFGAATAFLATVPTSVINTEYSPSQIGLKYIRVQIYPDYTDCNNVWGSCVTGPSGWTGAVINNSDLANIQAAVANGAVLWGAMWSPPGSMKSNGNFNSGGAFIGNPTNYTNLANIQTSFVTLMQNTYGISVYAISVQNEPDYSPPSYAGCTWTATQFHDYVPYLRSALNAAGYTSVKIMIPESAHWSSLSGFATTSMNDATVAADIGILGGHAYGMNGAAPPPSVPTLLSFSNVTNQHFWETETSDQEPNGNTTYDGTMVSGLVYAQLIHQYLTIAKVNAWHYWLISGADRGENSGLTDSSNNFAKRAYVMGNWARFATGLTEISATANPQTGVYVTAFKNLVSGKFVVVAINTNSGSVAQNFTFAGGLSASTVTPYITDPTHNLAAQSAISVSGSGVNVTLTGQSVTTFVSN